MQKKQNEWTWEWNKTTNDNSLWLFKEWIYPNKIEDFKDQRVLDGGCGSGSHIKFVSPYAKEVVGVDLNSAIIAKRRDLGKNVKIIEGDLAEIKLKEKFDIVYSIGVIHHTDDPNKTFKNMKSLTKKEGKIIIWVYSYEGNFLNRTLLENLKRKIFLKLNKKVLWLISNMITGIIYFPVYSIYLLPIKSLPFYDYFGNWRKLKFSHNNLNIFDKLNAPTTHFIDKKTLNNWFNNHEFKDIHISSYKGVSFRASGTKR